jgi:hypothetical protein
MFYRIFRIILFIFNKKCDSERAARVSESAVRTGESPRVAWSRWENGPERQSRAQIEREMGRIVWPPRTMITRRRSCLTAENSDVLDWAQSPKPKACPRPAPVPGIEAFVLITRASKSRFRWVFCQFEVLRPWLPFRTFCFTWMRRRSPATA